MIDSNLKFKINLSRFGYTSKAAINEALHSQPKLAFDEKEVTIDELISFASNGYAFCGGLFQFNYDKYRIRYHKMCTYAYTHYKRGINKGALKLSFKKDEFFSTAQVVFVDIDSTRFQCIQKYLDRLTIQPAAVYTSYSDAPTCRKFRMVYIFNRLMNITEFKIISKYVHDTIQRDTNEVLVDKCGMQPSHYFNGTFNPAFTKVNYIVYDVDVMLNNIEVEQTKLENELLTTSIYGGARETTDDFTKPAIEINNDMVNYMKFHTDAEIMNLYFDRYEVISITPVRGGDVYRIIPKEEVEPKIYYPKQPLHNGQHRRKNLFRIACLVRYMDRECTPEQLLWNLWMFRRKHINDDDGVVNVDCLVNIVRNSLKKSYEWIRREYASSFKHYRNYAVMSQGLSQRDKLELIKQIKTEISANEVKNGESTLKKSRKYEIIKENNLLTEKQKSMNELLVMYNPVMSLSQNSKSMNISIKKVRTIKKKYNELNS